MAIIKASVIAILPCNSISLFSTLFKRQVHEKLLIYGIEHQKYKYVICDIKNWKEGELAV